MSGARLVCITRRFWPLVGGGEVVMARLAAAFQSAGWATTILTAQWQRDWPIEFEHGGVRVVRLPNPAVRYYGTWRYMQALAAWLAARRRDFDLAYVSMLKHDAYAAIGAGERAGFPVVLRAEGAGLSGDCHWQLSATGGARIKRRCFRARAFVAPSEAIHRELVAAGYARDRIHSIPNGVAVRPTRSAARRAQARAELADHARALRTSPDAPVALFTGRLHAAKGLVDLIDAWREVVARLPAARLWLVGEGPFRAELIERIEARGLSGSVVLAGAFDDVEEFLAAADLFVLPSHEEGMSMALLEAMAAGLPIVASDIHGNRTLIENGRHGRLAPKQDPAALASAIVDMFTNREQAAALAAAARGRASAEFSLDRTVQSHLALFQQLLDQRRKSP